MVATTGKTLVAADRLAEVRELPILFSGQMVRAILAGRQTMTRRIVKPQPPSVEAVREKSGSEYRWMPPERGINYWRVAGPVWAVRELMGREPELRCPYAVGYRLWVRETWAQHPERSDGTPSCRVAFRADGQCFGVGGDGTGGSLHIHHGWLLGAADLKQLGRWVGREMYGAWKPSTNMPRKFSRITLEITGVRVERLKEITGKDVAAEGFPFSSDLDQFKAAWNELHGAGAWDRNDLVWCISFERIGGPA